MNPLYALPVLALPLLAVPLSAVSGRWGILPLLVPRRTRAGYRSWRQHSRWWNKPRGSQKSSRFSKDTQARIMAADRHRCLKCGSRSQLQYDHRVPWSLGGLSVLWNGAILCKRCNLIKSNYWKSDSGMVYYRAWRGFRDKPAAARILLRERAALASPWRWMRAYGLLPSW
jgi:5-methylcytosine-specific restriction endonuclease McrA